MAKKKKPATKAKPAAKKPAKKKAIATPPAPKGLTKLEMLGMEGVIANYRRGRHTLHPKQCILVFQRVKSRKEANKLIGRTVSWTTASGKDLKGVITRAHGNNGAVRAHFKKAGLPGQALGTKIKIVK